MLTYPTLCAHLVSCTSNVCTFNTCLGLKDNIYNMMVEKTLEAGVDGPAVGLWVTLCLLRMADKRDTDEVRFGMP